MDHLPELFEPILFAGFLPAIGIINDRLEHRSVLLEDNLCCVRQGQFVLTIYSINNAQPRLMVNCWEQNPTFVPQYKYHTVVLLNCDVCPHFLRGKSRAGFFLTS